MPLTHEDLNTATSSTAIPTQGSCSTDIYDDDLSEKNTVADSPIEGIKLIKSGNSIIGVNVLYRDKTCSFLTTPRLARFYLAHSKSLSQNINDLILKKFGKCLLRCLEEVESVEESTKLEKLVQTYQEIEKIIAEAAKKTDKPTLFIIGENHYQGSSLLIEMMLIQQLRYKFNLTQLFHESTEEFIKEVRGGGGLTLGFKENISETSQTVRYLVPYLNKNGIKTLPIGNHDAYKLRHNLDSHNYSANEVVEIREKLAKIRDNSFAYQIAIQHQNHADPSSVALAIVGSDHLKGIASTPDLNKKFNIILINTSRSNTPTKDEIAYYVGAKQFSFDSSKVTQLILPMSSIF